MKQTNQFKSGCLTSWFAIVVSFLFFFPLGIVLLAWRIILQNKHNKAVKTKTKCFNAIRTGGLRNLNDIAAAANCPPQTVKKIVEDLIQSNALPGGYINEQTNILKLPIDNQPRPATNPVAPTQSTAIPVAPTQNTAIPQQNQNAPRATAAPVPAPAPRATQAMMPQTAVPAKNESSRFFWLCVIISTLIPLCFVPVSFANGNILRAILCVVAAIVIVVAAIVSVKIERGQKYCTQCKRKFSFEEDVEYQEISQYTKRNNRPNTESNPKNQIQEQLFAKIRFKCHCPNCRAVQTFDKNFELARIYWDGHEKEFDTEGNIEKFFASNPTGKLTGLLALLMGVVFTILVFFITMM